MKEQIILFFEKLNHFLAEKNEFDFSGLWNTQSYGRNVGGPEALSGEHIYYELSDNDLLLVPETDFELNENSQTQLVGAYLKKENSSVDYIYIVLDISEHDFKIIAASRSKIEMEAIIERKLPVPLSIQSKEEDTILEISQEELFEQYFSDINRAFNHHAENTFAGYWIEKAYFHNLSGEGGLSGKELYTLATNANWQLNPIFELSTFFEKPDAILIHLSIWLKTLEMEKPGDEGLLLLIKTENKVKILGYGTDLSSMRHLYLKYKEGSVL
jgi:hypothetical protein